MPEIEALAYMLSMLVMVLKRFLKDCHLVYSSVPYGVSKERGKKSRSDSTRTRRLRHRSRPVLVQDGALAATFGTFLFVSDPLIARAFCLCQAFLAFSNIGKPCQGLHEWST